MLSNFSRSRLPAMTTSLKHIFAQPYPYYYRGRSLLLLLVAIFVAATAFNYLFEPFGINPAEQRMSYFWICAVHSLNATLAILLVAFFSSLVVRDELWTIGKELALIAIFLLVVGVAQFLLRDLVYDNPKNWSMAYLLEEIRNTYLIGGLILLMLISFNFNRLYYQNRIGAQSIVIKSNSSISAADRIPITTDVRSDDFHLDVTSFLFARSDKNYLHVYHAREDGIDRKLVRMTLTDLSDQLENHERLLRVHRSFLVNLDKVTSVDGNASGYRLEVEPGDQQVAVSRSYIPEFENRMSKVG